MKFWKRCGMALAAAALLTVLSGAALAAEPAAGAAEQAISVQLNGELVSFTDAAPEVVDQRTFLPFRALLEAMGAEVGYDAETAAITAQRNGVGLSMVLGEKQVLITQDGKTRTVEMDTAAYAKNNRTYVPVRFAAEALGCSVGWDQRNQTVVLVDVDALFGDATFELLDRFAAYCAKQKAPENMALAGSLTIDASDSSGEALAAPLQAAAALDGIVGEKGLQLSGQLNISGLTELLQKENPSMSPLERTVMTQTISALSELKAELRMDFAEETLYMALPASLTGLPEGAWYSLDLEEYAAQLLELMSTSGLTQLEEASVEEALVWVIKAMPVDSVDTYSVLNQVVSIYVELLSDQAFTKQGNTYTAQTVLEGLLTTTITLTEQGGDIVALDVSMTASADQAGMAVTLAMSEHAEPGKVTVEMDMSLTSGTLNVKLHLDLSCLPTDKAPEIRPPAGAQIAPMN